MKTSNLMARAQTTIDSSVDKVWEALVDPKMIREYMFGATVISNWKKGSPILWKGEFNGKKYEDKGEILEIVPGKKLAYSHFSPLSGLADKQENYRTVTIELHNKKKLTHVTLTQDKNDSRKAQHESEKNWSTMLEMLKSLLEK